MRNAYDNFQKLVEAVVKREHDWQLARCDSLSSNSSSSSTVNDDADSSGSDGLIIRARELTISWGEDPEYWNWTSDVDSRFSEVVELKRVCWLDVKCKIETEQLSRETTYGAYLLFKLSSTVNGSLESVFGVVRSKNSEAELDAEKRASLLRLGGGYSTGTSPVKRDDGWMEIELGDFFNEQGDDGEVEARLMDIRSHWKSGLIVEGIEFRAKIQPLENISGNGSREESQIVRSPSEPEHRFTTAEEVPLNYVPYLNAVTGNMIFPVGAANFTIPRRGRPFKKINYAAPDSRFLEVATFLSRARRQLDIRNTERLSQNSTYGGYQLFKLATVIYNLRLTETIRSVSFDVAIDVQGRTSLLDPNQQHHTGASAIPHKTGKLKRIAKIWCSCLKSGFIVQGIQFLPGTSYDHIQQTGKKSFYHRSEAAYDLLGRKSKVLELDFSS